MTQNMGPFDRRVRAFVVAPAAIVGALILGAGTVGGIILFIVAGVMLAMAITGFCPPYALLGISTHPRGLRRVGHRLRGGHAQKARQVGASKSDQAAARMTGAPAG